MLKKLRQRAKQSRAFFFALFAVVVVWVVSAMSESKSFHETYIIGYDNIDTACYAVTRYDSTITLDITSNGFYAFRRGISKHRTLHVNAGAMLKNDTLDVIHLAFNTTELNDSFRSQLDMRGVKEVSAVNQRLQLDLARRTSKTFTPSIGAVQFLFEGNAGLCGEPQVIPSVVTLYGSQASLDKIDSIKAAPQIIRHIHSSGKYTIRIDDSWKKYSDLRIASPTIDIYLPVEQFIEHQYTVPISIDSAIHGQYRLYPSQVTVTAMVPLKEYAKVTPNDFLVSALSQGDTTGQLLTEVRQFPANTRVKSIQPTEVQYIIIEK